MINPHTYYEKKKLHSIDIDISNCKRCKRLINYCSKVAQEKRKSFEDWDYWGKPVPNFGDYKAKLIILGLAPAAHGANRTGQMFTGDNSGLWLFRALHRAGFANKKNAKSLKDNLKLKNALITSVCHCAPPANKPTAKEIANCASYLKESLEVTKPKVFLALGGIAWKELFRFLKNEGLWTQAYPKFAHNSVVKLNKNQIALSSYHPSQHNTFTGRLTEDMFDEVFATAKKHI